MPVPDDTVAALAEIRDRNEGRIRFYAYTECTVEHDAAEGDVRRLLAALDAALKHHQRTPLYGDASTLENPGACPHDPEQDRDCHFESNDGEWLCGGQPEGFACSCTQLPDGERIPYPCDEVAAILAALTGKEASDAR
jgi:hypothetical protein